MNLSDVIPPPLTVDLPGVFGKIKSSPEDFVVEEVPVYQPCGEGEHLFLWIQKRDVSAEELVKRISRAAQVSRNDIGVAGLKDRFAITRQFVSVPATAESALATFADEQIQILSQTRHTNKLRTGHLLGNRFEIVVRETPSDAEARISEIAQRLSISGMPNYYGSQRFGRAGETLSLGCDLLAGRKSSGDIPRKRRKFLLRLALSAAQSFLFNQYVGRRIADGQFSEVQLGDVMEVTATRGKFVVTDVVAEQLRCNTGEISITGPLFGSKMKAAEREPAGMESKLLTDYDFTSKAFDQFPKLTRGARRPIAIRELNLRWEFKENKLRFEFFLPAGSYATILLREFIREENP